MVLSTSESSVTKGVLRECDPTAHGRYRKMTFTIAHIFPSAWKVLLSDQTAGFMQLICIRETSEQSWRFLKRNGK